MITAIEWPCMNCGRVIGVQRLEGTSFASRRCPRCGNLNLVILNPSVEGIHDIIAGVSRKRGDGDNGVELRGM